MIVKQINWLSRASLEAEVIISDGKIDLLCFAHPMNYQEGQSLIEPLIVLDVSGVVKSNDYTPPQKQSDTFEYYLTGKIIDKENGIIEIGNIQIEINSSSIPQDINQGEFISFQCSRLDL